MSTWTYFCGHITVFANFFPCWALPGARFLVFINLFFEPAFGFMFCFFFYLCVLIICIYFYLYYFLDSLFFSLLRFNLSVSKSHKICFNKCTLRTLLTHWLCCMFWHIRNSSRALGTLPHLFPERLHPSIPPTPCPQRMRVPIVPHPHQ